MIPKQLVHALNKDLYPANSQAPRHLVALVDMALLSLETRRELAEDPCTELKPLLVDPALVELSPLAAHLVTAREPTIKGHNSLMQSMASYNTNTIVAWIVSSLAPDALAHHFSQATYAHTESGERYLLRYYDNRVTSLLCHHAERQWSDWFLAPIVSWWISGANTQFEQWHQIVGHARVGPAQVAPNLVLSPSLQNALQVDPLPHRMLEMIVQQTPELLNSPFRGVRLALIESLIAAGREQGLLDHHNLNHFVMLNLQHTPELLKQDPHWQTALQRAANGQGHLSQMYTYNAPTQRSR